MTIGLDNGIVVFQKKPMYSEDKRTVYPINVSL